MNLLRLPPNVAPIFLAGVFIDFDRHIGAIQRVAASTLRTGNPIILSRLYAVVVGLEASALEAPERLTTVIECAQPKSMALLF
jgi:hypothetical protein